MSKGIKQGDWGPAPWFEKRDYDKESRQAARRCNLDRDICKSLLLDGWRFVQDDLGWSWEKPRCDI